MNETKVWMCLLSGIARSRLGTFQYIGSSKGENAGAVYLVMIRVCVVDRSSCWRGFLA